jgi:hypothetical protein
MGNKILKAHAHVRCAYPPVTEDLPAAQKNTIGSIKIYNFGSSD